ncbi:hypothetical protein O3M35_005825 [Rhynocoris fuscipes]|uniref:palmitoyl-CoA hydrolase n=1 Tax=Rhynocoris fuscipes TaxID=488301 RepID=A0AAW1DQG5_9HEMI
MHSVMCIILIFSIFIICSIDCYKPVIIIHGVLSEDLSMQLMADRIRKLHPGTEVFVTNRFNGWSSVRPMWHQVLEIGSDALQFMAFHPDGVNMIGYSQGGLIARGILQQFPEHNVKTFISLSAPQNGQYGTKFLHLFFPTLACETAYELFYSMLGQDISVGNYWNDPHHQQLFFEYSNYLPFINNLIISNKSDDYKRGMTKLKRMVLIGGPDDGVITPWQSSHFGYYDGNESIIEMREQPFYKNDSFGLKTLDKSGRLHTLNISGFSHYDWHLNVSFIDNYVLPFLD